MSTLSQILAKELREAVRKVFEEDGKDYPDGLDIRIEQPALHEHGDYASGIPLQLSKRLCRSPLNIAERLQIGIELQGSAKGLLSRIEIVSPGFINFFVNWDQWAQQTFELPQNSGEKVILEHTSINPNKSAHIGHLRNACIGDTLARLFRRAGYLVEVHNYIDDLGNQLADTVVGLLHLPLELETERFGDYCWELYARLNRQFEESPEWMSERDTVLHSLEKGTGNIAWIGRIAAERMVREHLQEMKSFDIDYDLLIWESDIVHVGFWEETFRLLMKTGSFFQETHGPLMGCWILRQGQSDVELSESEHIADKVLIRSNGVLTYTAKDIAYHLWKFGLLEQDFRYRSFEDGIHSTYRSGSKASYGNATLVVNVIDSRQQYPQAMVKQAFERLGFSSQAEKLKHVGYGVVSLSPTAAKELGIDISSGKSSYAMSGRQGIGIKVSDLLDRMEAVIEKKRSDKSGLTSRTIAAAAIRYYLLRFTLPTEVVFDIGQATTTTGNSGVYLMYSHARAASLLSKAANPCFTQSISFPLDKTELALLRQLSLWEDTLQLAIAELAPSSICTYAHQLAVCFNAFYSTCPILKAPDSVQSFRLWLTVRFQATMADALSVLGIPAPQRM
ncbi:arginine--tRNA ligase [Gorillibacterium sp. sgz500922]|uniref:arginine--tRNA ligase n=1 Tax=Gorillibacterium sp. sgz500922 TaxID=3446694 RepID=UPI003F67D02C